MDRERCLVHLGAAGLSSMAGGFFGHSAGFSPPHMGKARVVVFGGVVGGCYL